MNGFQVYNLGYWGVIFPTEIFKSCMLSLFYTNEFYYVVYSMNFITDLEL